ncbi:ATP-binding protein [Cylindrospermopsis raciborskii]|uniref:Polyketide biosynthesis operon protein CyrO n=5 Tax=Cylindrospermopsis raciborskii TaxID=77022 RepID=A0A853MJJ1_9CYAN|nr:ATP-binding protein [Cylindrospermopsis raciborskii]OBU77258.1 polyketide biosynthesis operon protein CyrO [Cylindrospermopsis raciborskii CS-505]PNK14844.1 ATP-binding protein [Cylindrospermopsis raciborskii S05]PNK15576.1 ATP-binding protein [Cylindrospermopsis raciborskii S06]
MSKHFNTAGPCQSDIHYMISPTGRLPQLKALIDGRNYFIIHAPRQVGKTTAMMALAQELTDSGQYLAVILTVETGAPFPDAPEQAQQSILRRWQNEIRFRKLPLPNLTQIETETETSPLDIQTVLQGWAMASPLPLVVFLDEIDSLEDQTLISILRQLRAGYPNRPQGFPHSVGLIGMRDVRDYKVKSGGSERLNTSSPFNIKAESLTLSNFSFTDVQNLYEQHTTATGQVFTPEAVQQAYYLTDGQPWLVNALARQATQVLVQDVNEPITAEVINQAKEILIQRQDTHLDSLAERLREARVKTIIEPILAGEDLPDVPPDDIRYVLDLGLCRDQGQGLEIANPIYKEVLPLVLSYTTRVSIGAIELLWLNEQGELLPDKLLHAFLEFWRQHGEPLLKSAPYHEIAPHLVLMAFLHRVVNGGGTLEREYAIGSGRMDICLRYGKVVMGIELKLWRERKSDPLIKGLTQLDKYLDGLGLDTGWLVIFDRRPGLPPMGERISTEEVISPRGRTITLIRS